MITTENNTLREQAQREGAIEQALVTDPEHKTTPVTTGLLRTAREATVAPIRTFAPSPQTVEVVLYAVELSPEDGTPLCSDDELAKLKASEETLSKLYAERSTYSLAKVSQEIIRQRDELHAKALAGSPLDGITLASHDEITRNFAAKSEAIRKRCVQVFDSEARSIIEKVLTRLEDRLETYLRDTETSDRELASLYGVPWQPSLQFVAAASVLITHNKQKLSPRPERDALPSKILAGLVSFSGGAQ